MDFVKRRSGDGPVKGGAVWLGCALSALLASVPVAAQSKGIGTTKTLEGGQLKAAYETLLGSDGAWKALVDGALNLGFSPTTRWSNGQWGLQGLMSLNGKAVTVTWYVFDLDQLGSPDAAALQYISDGSRTYRALDIARDRDPDSMQEYTVAGDAGSYQMTRAAGFWACLKNSLQSACGETCGAAFAGCNQAATRQMGVFSLAAYLGCISDSCGACLANQAVTCALP